MIQIVAQPRSQGEQGRNPQRGGEILVKLGCIVGIEPVHHPADRDRQHQADGCGQHKGKGSQGQQTAIGPQERHQPPKRADLA
jgi:hypothetical protein